MKNDTRIVMMCCVAVLAILIAPARAAIQVNDKTDIDLTVFVPCAADGAAHFDLIYHQWQQRQWNNAFSATGY